jgi:hypothetical protein
MHRLRGGGGRCVARGARRAVPARDRDRRHSASARPERARLRVPPGRRRTTGVFRRVPSERRRAV